MLGGRSGSGMAAAALFGAALLAASCSDTEPATSGTVAANAPVTESQVLGTVHVCTSCHGFEGRSISPTFPNLAGQQPGYIETQLKAFRDHKRADPHAQTYMWGMAGHLSDAMIHGIAEFFSKQKPAVGESGNSAMMAAGETIFRHGLPKDKVLPCQSCHGVHAQGMGTIPRLAGQHPEYIEKQLEYFSSNARQNAIMHHNARALSTAQIAAVAAYASAQ